MEIIILISVLITFIFLSISFYVNSLCKGKTWAEPSLPPGRKGLPFIGETLDFYRSCQGKPESFFNARVGKFSSEIFRTSLFGENMVVFCGAAANKFLFTRANEIVTPAFPKIIQKILPIARRDGLSTLKESRKLHQEFFKPEFLQKKFVGSLDLVLKDQFDKYHRTPQQQVVVVVVVYDLAKEYLFHLSCRLFLNLNDRKKEENLQQLYTNIVQGLHCLPLDLPGTTFNRAVKSSRTLRNEVASVIKQRKIDLQMSEETPADHDAEINASTDLLSHMLKSTFNQYGEFPSDVIIADMFLAFLVAGIKSVSSTITFLVKNLAEFPCVHDQLLQEQMEIAKTKKPGELLNWEDIQKMKYTWCVAQETMRLTPPTPGTFRDVLVNFTYAGFTIPKGWKIHWTVHSTNKDPECFKNPEEFDPTRFENGGPPPYTFVPFGGGLHICPGREYAKIQILVFIHNLVTQFQFETLLPKEKERIILTAGATLVSGLPIRLRRRYTE